MSLVHIIIFLPDFIIYNKMEFTIITKIPVANKN